MDDLGIILFNHIHDSLVVFGKTNSEILEVNTSACYLYGYPRGEFIGKTLRELSKDWDGERLKLAETIEEGKNQKYAAVHSTGDGCEILLEVSALPIECRGQKAALCIIHPLKEKNVPNIVERSDENQAAIHQQFGEVLLDENDEYHRTERMLRERLDLLALATGDLIFDWDVASDRVQFNNVSNSYYESQSDEKDNAAEYWTGNVHPNDVGWLQRKYRLFVEMKEQFWSAEYRIRHKDGHYITVCDRAYLTYDDEGNPVRMVGISTDISERLSAEESRKQVLKRLVTAHENERKHLAREMHDQLGQYLMVLSLGLDSLKESISLAEATTDQVDDLQIVLNELAQEAHRIEHNLHPAGLEAVELLDVINDIVDTWREQTGIDVTVGLDVDEKDLSLQIKVTLYRLIQESLVNIYKHARASQVSLLLKKQDGEVVLTIDDNGRGFDSQDLKSLAKFSGGLGIHGMRERVESLGGHFEINSRPGKGTSISARLELGGNKEKDE
jgi:PAS domain S-box-containing protein